MDELSRNDGDHSGYRKETFVIGHRPGPFFLLLSAFGQFKPVEDLRNLSRLKQFKDFESAEARAIAHDASVFEVWRRGDKVVLLRWDTSDPGQEREL